MTEAQLHKAVVHYLNLALPKDAVFCHVMNEGKRGWKTQRDLKDSGVLAGVPDLLIFWRGTTTFIELKTPKGVVSSNQKSVHHRLLATGFPVSVCRSLADVFQALAESKIPLCAAIAFD